jgi:hypothetical protein
MRTFQPKKLHSLVEAASARIDGAQRIEDIAARTDGLLAAREENGATLRAAAWRQTFKVIGAGAMAIVGGLAAALGVMTARSIFAILAGTTGYAIPLAIAGVIVCGGGLFLLAIAAVNYKRVKDSLKSLNAKIDLAVSGLIEAYPQETSKSSRLAAFLKQTFDRAASRVKPGSPLRLRLLQNRVKPEILRREDRP